MIFIFSLVIAALLCIASFICYKVSGKMLDEKDAEKCAKEAELEEKLIDLIEHGRTNLIPHAFIRRYVRLHAFVRNRYYRCWGASCERVC